MLARRISGKAFGVLSLFCAATVLHLETPRAVADVDLDGPWRILAVTSPFLSPDVSCIVDVVQAGGALSITGNSCTIAVALTGTINPTTGVFSASGASDPLLCPTLSVSGTASPASDAFTGTFDCNGIIPVAGPFSGGLCGNGVSNSGEECDDGDVQDSDCCSPSCTFDPPSYSCLGDGTICTVNKCDGNGTCVAQPDAAGKRCESDGNSCTDDVCNGSGLCTHTSSPAGSTCFADFEVCTDDVCDGSGTCLAIDNTAPCTDFNTCTVGDTCSGGSCVPGTTFAPAGIRCDADSDLCTLDECDGAGTCANAGCSRCCGGFFCTAVLDTSCAAADPSSSQLQMTHREGSPAKNRLKFKWHGSTALGDLGDPTSATSYEICLYETEFSPPRLEFQARADAGAMCAGEPCWKPKGSSGFGYKDFDLTPDGLEQMRLKSSPAGAGRIAVKGKGANLGFNRLVFLDPPLTVQLKASNGKCWGATYTAAKLTQNRLKAKNGQ
jgi:cysteine-rich repeat protein